MGLVKDKDAIPLKMEELDTQVFLEVNTEPSILG